MGSKQCGYNIFRQSLQLGFSRGSCTRGPEALHGTRSTLCTWKYEKKGVSLLLKYEVLFIHLRFVEAAKHQEECLHVPPQESRIPLQIICTKNHLFEKWCPINSCKKTNLKSWKYNSMLKWHQKQHRTMPGWIFCKLYFWPYSAPLIED